MVMDGNNWVVIFFYQCTYKVISTFLHFRVSTLYGIQLNTI